MLQTDRWTATRLDIGSTRLLLQSSFFVGMQRRFTQKDVLTHRARATPKNLKIGTLPDDRLRLRRPLNVTIMQECNMYVATCKELEEFGYGDDPFEAIDDLRQAISELYWTFDKEQGRLGSALAKLWVILQSIVEVP